MILVVGWVDEMKVGSSSPSGDVALRLTLGVFALLTMDLSRILLVFLFQILYVIRWLILSDKPTKYPMVSGDSLEKKEVSFVLK